jgi:ribosomal protein L36
MKVRASVKPIGPKDKSVWRRPKNKRHKAKLFIISSSPKNKQRQG